MDSITEAAVTIRRLGPIGYDEARSIQDGCVARRINGSIGDMVYTLEHPETITLGRRSTSEDYAAVELLASDPTISVAIADRGGRATYHGPGQLVIYPVVSLPVRNWGVRKFVGLGLETIAKAVTDLGLRCDAQLDPAGVWINGRKIASVGIRVIRGVTNHGFSLNVSNSLARYQTFSPCGLPSAAVTTLAMESGRAIEIETVESAVSRAFFELLR